ncbi:MAG TPA: DNA methyltransferase [Candidatus Cloacimonas sp.]|nr:DNA methyltransferase [Candidatus Cloacimonas sp.]
MIIQGNCLEILPTLESESVQCVVTSPPYFGLRDYGVEGQIGLEKTPEEYVKNLVSVFREVKRVLKKDGTVWLNLGDSYAGGGRGFGYGTKQDTNKGCNGMPKSTVPKGLKPKDLIGIPWRVAFALQEDGWWLRQDIIWCLSGETWLYVRSQKGDMPMMLCDAVRLDPTTVKLWNGERWTQVLGWSRHARQGTELEIVLRSGERISCTPTHKFPTQRGLLVASELRKGDVLERVQLPEPEFLRDCVIDDDAAWIAGLYIAKGSMSDNTIQIACSTKEENLWNRVCSISKKFGGSATRMINWNQMNIRVYGKLMRALLFELVTGYTAKDKGFASVVWRYSNTFIKSMMQGYLDGNGSWDSYNKRWIFRFIRNHKIESDLRTACARLGWRLVLNLSSVPYNDRNIPTFQGEIRMFQSNHHNEKADAEIMEIRKAQCCEVYDVGVADEPHLFALSSGILSHNSKPNPMPESVKDRCTKSHEYIFLLTKSAKYYYDINSIKEPQKESTTKRYKYRWNGIDDDGSNGARTGSYFKKMKSGMKMGEAINSDGMKNKRSVWNISTKPFKGAHFAIFPPEIPEICIRAGSKIGDTVLDPFSGAGTTGIVAEKLGRKYIGIELNSEYVDMSKKRINDCPFLMIDSE